MFTDRRAGLGVVGALALLPAALGLVACTSPDESLPDIPTPRAVPAGSVAVVGDSPISDAEYEAALDMALTGYDPLSPTRTNPEPLDPPKFTKCVAAIQGRAKDDPDLRTLGRGEFLEACRDRYEQSRALALSTLIDDRWALVEAEAEGIEVTDAEADAFIEQAKGFWATDPARSRALFNRALTRSGVSQATLRADARAAVARQRLGALESGQDQDPEALAEAERERFEAWRAKTLCAKELAVPQCSNGPES